MTQDILHAEVVTSPNGLAHIQIKPGAGCNAYMYPEFTAVEMDEFIAECNAARNKARQINSQKVRSKWP